MSLSTDNAYHRFGLSAMLEKSKKKKKKNMGEGQSLTVLQETKQSLYHVISSVVWDSKDSTSYLNNYLV